MSGPDILQLAFMRHAFAAAGCIAVAGSLVGYFVVLRRQAFAAHTLANVGFVGAAGATLLGVSPMLGLLIFVLASALGISVTGARPGDRDISVGMVLMASLGLGLLFLNIYSGNANTALGILFGSVLGIDVAQTRWIAGVSLLVLAALAVLFRPLRFASLNEAAARARGVPVRVLNTCFLLLVAAVAAAAVPVIGALLSFAILIGPAAAAQAWCNRVGPGLALTAALALVQTWSGLLASFYIGYPATSWIALISFLLYLSGTIPGWRRHRRHEMVSEALDAARG